MGFIAMWRPETNGDWQPGMTLADFKKRDDDNAKAGLVLVCLRQVGDGAFAAVWLPGTQGTPWVTGENVTAFNAADTAQMKKGYRLGDIQIINPSLGTTPGVAVNNIEHSAFTCVWRPGAGAQQDWGDLDHKALVAEDKTFQGQGLQLNCLRIQDDGRLFGVWLQGSGGAWTPPLAPSDFITLGNTHFGNGLRLVDIDTKDSSTYAGVWHKGSGAMFWMDDSLSAIEAADIEHKKAGLRIFKLIPHNDQIFPVGPGKSLSGGLGPGSH